MSKTADDLFIKREFTSAARDYGEAVTALNGQLNDSIDDTLGVFLMMVSWPSRKGMASEPNNS